jgi:hypothetical protein
VETLTKQQFKRLHLTFREMPPADAFTLEGIHETGRQDHTVMLEVFQGMDKLMQIAAPFGIQDIDAPPVTLEEIFLTFYDRKSNGNGSN